MDASALFTITRKILLVNLMQNQMKEYFLDILNIAELIGFSTKEHFVLRSQFMLYSKKLTKLYQVEMLLMTFLQALKTLDKNKKIKEKRLKKRRSHKIRKLIKLIKIRLRKILSISLRSHLIPKQVRLMKVKEALKENCQKIGDSIDIIQRPIF